MVELDGHTIKAHKFVLAARSDTWGVPDLGIATKLDLSGKLLVYTDFIKQLAYKYKALILQPSYKLSFVKLVHTTEKRHGNNQSIVQC